MTTVEVPDRLDLLLTPAWLSAALATRFPGVHVSSVTPGPITERLSTNARFHIEGDLPAGLPADLCAKGYFTDRNLPITQSGEPEASFYRDLAGPTGVRTLHCVWADVHPETRSGVILTEDLIAAGGEFRDALSPCSVDDTASILDELARLHAHVWERPVVASSSWLEPRVARTLEVRGIKEITHNFEGPPGVGVPDDVRDAQQLVDAFRAIGNCKLGAGWTVIHGDAHVGNTFVDADGRPGLLDWQVTQHGHWGIDVGYHVASALEPAERAGAERDLLRHYLDRLASEGVTPPPFDDAWDDYRRGIAYGFFFWGITQYVSQDIITVLLHRLGTAAFELDSYGALRDP